MRIQGKRVKLKRWIHTEHYVVRVELDAVIPVDDPSEPCFEPQAVEFLRQVRERAEAGDVQWLKQVGEVYVPAGA